MQHQVALAEETVGKKLIERDKPASIVVPQRDHVAHVAVEHEHRIGTRIVFLGKLARPGGERIKIFLSPGCVCHKSSLDRSRPRLRFSSGLRFSAGEGACAPASRWMVFSLTSNARTLRGRAGR